MQRKTYRYVLTALSLSTTATAQSVLDLQKDYHIGFYSGSIGIPSGSLSASAGIGEIALTAAGDMTFTLDSTEITAASATQSSGIVFSGNYSVEPSGELVYTEPGNPNQIRFWIDTDGSVMHSTRTATTDTETLNIIAFEKGSGLSNATLNGDYYFVSHTFSYNGGDWEMSCEWGTFVFNGAGFAAINGTELFTTSTGSSTSSFFGSTLYSVASDGTLTFDGEPGAVSADGELAFQVLADPAEEELSLTIAVKLGFGYDHNDVTGRYGLTGKTVAVVDQPNSVRPRTTTDYGELFLGATSPTTGTWAVDVLTINGNENGVNGSNVQFNGTTTLTPNGLLTMTDPSGSLEFGVSESGRYLIGRVIEPETNMTFAMRQCAAAGAYGTGTPGTGGVTPQLSMKTFPTLGNSGWQLTVRDGIGNGIAVVAVGTDPAPGLPALGGLIWVNPLTSFYSALVPLGGALGTAGTGTGNVPFPLPANPSVAGFRVNAQALVLDPAGPAGFAMSSGFEAVVCR